MPQVFFLPLPLPLFCTVSDRASFFFVSPQSHIDSTRSPGAMTIPSVVYVPSHRLPCSCSTQAKEEANANSKLLENLNLNRWVNGTGTKRKSSLPPSYPQRLRTRRPFACVGLRADGRQCDLTGPKPATVTVVSNCVSPSNLPVLRRSWAPTREATTEPEKCLRRAPSSTTAGDLIQPLAKAA